MLKRIPLDQIRRNPDQPRQHFDEGKLQELADSIRLNGLQQPITVRPAPEGVEGYSFMIVAGERRFRAHQILAQTGDATDILCHVRKKMDDETMHVEAILENLQRVDVSPLEEATAFQRLIDEYGYTPETLAEKLGLKQAFRVTERTALLALTEDNQELLRKGIITNSQAYYMAKLCPHGQKLFLDVCKQGLAQTASAAAAAVQSIHDKLSQTTMDISDPKPRATKSLRSLEDKIDAIGTATGAVANKEGTLVLGDDAIDVGEAQRCLAKLAGLQASIRQIEREIKRAAAVSAASAQC